jgi:hypothetical protein
MNPWDWAFGLVPFDPPLTPTQPGQPAPVYEDYRPYWYDLGIEAIRRGAETAQVIGAGGWPPRQQPAPLPAPLPYPVQQQQPSGAGIQLSTNTLMLLVGGFLLFTLGQRRGR